MTALGEASIFLCAVFGIFLIPGFLMRKALFRNPENGVSLWETLILSFGGSIGLVIFSMIIVGKLGIRFTPLSLLLAFAGAALAVALPLLFFQRTLTKNPETRSKASPGLSFSRKQSALFVLIIAVTILIKTLYLSHAILPTATDLGHHLYWAKLVSDTGSLPVYEEREIVTDPSGSYRISEPQAIADFIIGEHLPFSALNILTGASFFSAFPVVFLALINLFSLLALATFAFRAAQGLRNSHFDKKLFSAENIFLATLFLFGPLYTLASPQEKFVSGGVIGNTFGNFFIPLILLCYYRAFRGKDPRFLGLAFFFTFTLAYIHHLSTFILLFVLAGGALWYILFHLRTLPAVLKDWFRLMLAPFPLAILLSAGLFFFLVAMPTYIETSAVGTAVGTPSKATRTGLTFYQVSFSSGETRVALGLAGLLGLALLPWRKRYASAFLIGWAGMLLAMTLHPEWLYVDIPSNRIGAYLSFPLGVLAAFALVGIFSFRSGKGQSLPPTLAALAFTSLFVFALGSGSYDNSGTLLPQSKAEAALATFHASGYLAKNTSPEDIILKDHNYIEASDAWMKLFFMRGYTYPLSRGFFQRYEDNPDREQCTLLMISVPNTPKGEKCFDDTGTSIVVVNPDYDATQFDKSSRFSKIYASKYIAIYRRLAL